MDVKYKQKKAAEDIILVIKALSGIEGDYKAISELLRNCKSDWDGYEDVESGYSHVYKNVFSAWINSANSIFSRYNVKYEEKKELLRILKNDIDWWGKEKGPPSDKDSRGLKKTEIDTDSASTGSCANDITKNQELQQEWVDIWLNSGWIKDKKILNRFLLRAILLDNTSMVKKLISEKSLDINQDVRFHKYNYVFEICDLASKGCYNYDTHKIKLGFFVKSEKMAKVLSELGFNWDVVAYEDIELLTAIQNIDISTFTSRSERDKIIKYINDIKIGNDNKVKSVLSTLKSANCNSDIEAVLNHVDWTAIKGENGENFLHMLARYSPNFLHAYASTTTGLKQMRELDNEGRSPFEYFLSFSREDEIEENLSKLRKLIKNNLLPEPDWLEVKMLVAENKISYSGADQTSKKIWKQKTPEAIIAILKTERGQKFMEMAANNFQYGAQTKSYYKPTKRTNNGRNYGLEINKYTNSTTLDFYSFFEFAQTKSEVKLALAQSWEEAKSHLSMGINLMEFPANLDHVDIRKTVEDVTNKAINLDIDVISMKEKLLLSIPQEDRDKIDQFMCDNFESWKNLRERYDRNRLMKTVTNKSGWTNVARGSAL